MNIALSFSVVAPICIYILLGILVKRLKWIGEAGLTQTNKLLYSLFFPMIMFVNIYNSNLDESLNIELVLFLLILFTILFILLVLIIPLLLNQTGSSKCYSRCLSSKFPSLCDANYCNHLWTRKSWCCCSCCFFDSTNIKCILCCTLRTKTRNKVSLGKVALSVIKSPLIIGALLGLFVKLMSWTLPSIIEDVIFDMSKSC